MPKRALTAALAACLFLLIVGAKWGTFDRYGSPMPDWDQWDAEAVELFIPWFERDHFIAHLFHPHNEHRVVLTKLQNLALGLLNGQWDSRVEAATNAGLHAALGVAFWLCALRWIGVAPASSRPEGDSRQDAGATKAPHPAALFLLTVALFALPLAWQNILGGFHSQQYWLLGLSFAAIVALPFARPFSRAWWLGALAALLALGSMGSGFLAAAVTLVVVGWRCLRGEATWRAMAPTLAVTTALCAIGWFTRVEVPWHHDLKAKTAHDFIFSIVHSLEWPLRDRDWAAAVLWLPWLVVVGRVVAGAAARSSRFAGGGGDSVAAETIAALGGWVLIQIVATAYARGIGGDYPASRYMDTLAFGAMVNGVALAWLLKGPKDQGTKGPETKDDELETDPVTSTRSRWSAVLGPWSFGPWSLGPLLLLLALAWLATLAFGLHEVTDRNLRYELPDAKKYYVKAEGHMRRYLGTNDPRQLAYPDIPFPSAEGLIERLAKPSLRALMPVPIRAPLPLTAAAAVPGFRENDARGADPDRPPRAGLSPTTPPLDSTTTWGSFNADGKGAAETGTWRSQPITPVLSGWLKFETAGQVGDPNEGVLLELHAARTDALLARIRPDRPSGDSWRAAYARTPNEPFVVVAHDRHAARWLAFSGPAEMGRLSYWAWRITKHGFWIMYVAGAAGLCLAIAAMAATHRAAASAGPRGQVDRATNTGQP